MDNGIQVTFRVRRLADSLTPQIRRIREAIGMAGRRKVLMEAGNLFKSMAQSTFGAGNNQYRGNKWPRYSEAYAKKVGSSTPTLYRTGRLQKSIRVTAPRGNSVGVSANTPYAAAQFLGTRKGLPSRKYFPMEGAGTAAWRLTARAEKELTMMVGKSFSILSGGALPRNVGLQQRHSYTAGNPLTGLT